jgi:hypothetical protein
MIVIGGALNMGDRLLKPAAWLKNEPSGYGQLFRRAAPDHQAFGSSRSCVSKNKERNESRFIFFDEEVQMIITKRNKLDEVIKKAISSVITFAEYEEIMSVASQIASSMHMSSS